MLNNLNLLNKLIEDSQNISEVYKPSKYWRKKNIQAHEEIKKKGIKNFRGVDNNIGESFSDNQNINILNNYYGGLRGFLKFIIESVYPFKNIFTRQIKLASTFKTELNLFKSNYYENNKYVLDLSKKFILKNTANFGCEDFSVFNENKISNYYLGIADMHHQVIDKVDFRSVKTFFEIGGGFGANVHFILENYKNIKKIIYLDLPVNLYIATEYLRSFYGNSVQDYLVNRNKNICFNEDDKLEIFCIPPWKIKDLNIEFDIFQNSNSFVEMSPDIIKNYAFFIEKFMKKNSKIILSSYKNYNKGITLNPESLKEYFSYDFEQFNSPCTIPGKNNIYLISK